MSKKKETKVNELKVYKETGFYKGYDIRWLSKETHHADFYLVVELEALLKEEEK